jgi:hypothetical protein
MKIKDLKIGKEYYADWYEGRKYIEEVELIAILTKRIVIVRGESKYKKSIHPKYIFGEVKKIKEESENGKNETK